MQAWHTKEQDAQQALRDRRFPWDYEGLESCPCRIVCFEDADMSVEAIGDAARAIMPRR